MFLGPLQLNLGDTAVSVATGANGSEERALTVGVEVASAPPSGASMPTPTLLTEGTVSSGTGFSTSSVSPGSGVILELDIFSVEATPGSTVTGLGLTWTRLDDPTSYTSTPIQRWAAIVPRGATPPTPGVVTFSHTGSSGEIVYQLKTWTGFLGSVIDQAYRNFEEPYSGVRYAHKVDEVFDISGYPGLPYRSADRASVAFAGSFSASPTETPDGYSQIDRTQTGNIVLVTGVGNDSVTTTFRPQWSGATGTRRALYSEIRAEFFAEDLFETPAVGASIFGTNGGTGWPRISNTTTQRPWEVQDDWPDVAISAGNLAVSGLAGSSTGNRLSGGGLYRLGGRALFHRRETLPVAYFSAVVARNNSTSIVLFVSQSSFPASPDGSSIRFGCEGSNFARVWQEGGASSASSFVVPQDETPVHLILKVEWVGTAFTASLFINPTPGSAEPSTPAAQITGTHPGVRCISFSFSDYPTPVVFYDTVRNGEEWWQVTPTSAPPSNDVDPAAIRSEERTPGLVVSSSAPSIALSPIRSEESTPGVTVAGEATIGTPRSSARVFYSSHSLIDQPIPNQVEFLAGDAGLTIAWERQHIGGRPISAATKGSGAHPGTPPWNGYRTGENRVPGPSIDLVSYFRGITAGSEIEHFVICERHDTLNSLEWENTIPYLRHYYELIRERSPNVQGYLYSTWLDYDLADLTDWIAYCRATDRANAAIASRINASLGYEGRTDRLQMIPAAGAIGETVERATTLPGLPGITVFDGPDINVTATMAVLFEDTVHPTAVGRYVISCLLYGVLYRRDPRGRGAASGVTSTQATSLQNIAWDILVEYFGTAPHTGLQFTASAAKSEIVDYVPAYADFFPGTPINVPVYQSYWGGTSSVMHFDPPSTESIWYAPVPFEVAPAAVGSEERGTPGPTVSESGGAIPVATGAVRIEERDTSGPSLAVGPVSVSISSIRTEERIGENGAVAATHALSVGGNDLEERRVLGATVTVTATLAPSPIRSEERDTSGPTVASGPVSVSPGANRLEERDAAGPALSSSVALALAAPRLEERDTAGPTVASGALSVLPAALPLEERGAGVLVVLNGVLAPAALPLEERSPGPSVGQLAGSIAPSALRSEERDAPGPTFVLSWVLAPAPVRGEEREGGAALAAVHSAALAGIRSEEQVATLVAAQVIPLSIGEGAAEERGAPGPAVESVLGVAVFALRSEEREGGASVATGPHSVQVAPGAREERGAGVTVDQTLRVFLGPNAAEERGAPGPTIEIGEYTVTVSLAGIDGEERVRTVRVGVDFGAIPLVTWRHLPGVEVVSYTWRKQ